MKVNTLKNPQINQNGYHKNTLTKERIGALFIYPIEYTPNDCLPCDGYSLLIADYEELFKIIGTRFNQSEDSLETFRIPDYNITKNFLQPGKNAGLLIEAGLPEIEGGYRHHGWSGDSYYGACYDNFSSFNYFGSGTNALANKNGFKFKASAWNKIYGNSSTVQPPSQLVHICIKYK